MVKNKPAMTETQRCGLHPWVGKVPLKEEMAIHSSNLAWEILRAFIPLVLLFYENGPGRCWWSLPIFSTFQTLSPELPKSSLWGILLNECLLNE